MQDDDKPFPAHAAIDPEPHVLVVDDDGAIRSLVSKFLRDNGFRVSAARDGREMREVLDSAAINLVVLDVMLPGTSGLDLAREIRRTSSLPIVMLTAKGDETDRIVGLEIGADDYIAKPFSPRELLARIKAVLRRVNVGAAASGAPARLFRFEGWALDPARRELTDPGGVVVDLSTGEYDLLLAFIEGPQRVLSRDQLLDLARNRVATGFDRSIDVQISRLRRKIEPTESSPPMIKTIRGAGYMFVPKVERA
ncbi:Transcriptional regulatory protein OmpR [bacterium YEK0313]|nr:Transcriptional regulatory protein OmpR [bacterium YEK0313]